MLTSIGKKGGSLTLALQTNMFHITVSVSHFDEFGFDTEHKISVDEFTHERWMTYDSNRWFMAASLSL